MERHTALATILALLVLGGATGVSGAIPVGTDTTDVASPATNDSDTETDAWSDDGVDQSANHTVTLSDARETADEALPSPERGTWAIVESSIHETDGYYEFEYALEGTDASGEAEVRVDSSSGDVFRLERDVEAEETGADDGPEDENEDEQEDENENEDEQEDEEVEVEIEYESD